MGTYPSTQLSTNSCNVTLGQIGDWIYCDPIIGASDYEFVFTSESSGQQINYIRGTSAPNLNSGAGGLGLQLNETYQVQVRAYFGSQIGPFGDTCIVSTPHTTSISLDSYNYTLKKDSFFHSYNQLTQFTTFPNPNRGKELYIKFDSLKMQKCSVNVMLTTIEGGVVYEEIVSLKHRDTFSIKFENALSKGIYILLLSGEVADYHSVIIVN